jgi:hypothetical protein
MPYSLATLGIMSPPMVMLKAPLSVATGSLPLFVLYAVFDNTHRYAAVPFLSMYVYQ